MTQSVDRSGAIILPMNSLSLIALKWKCCTRQHCIRHASAAFLKPDLLVRTRIKTVHRAICRWMSAVRVVVFVLRYLLATRYGGKKHGGSLRAASSALPSWKMLHWTVSSLSSSESPTEFFWRVFAAHARARRGVEIARQHALECVGARVRAAVRACVRVHALLVHARPVQCVNHDLAFEEKLGGYVTLAQTTGVVLGRWLSAVECSPTSFSVCIWRLSSTTVFQSSSVIN